MNRLILSSFCLLLAVGIANAKGNAPEKANDNTPNGNNGNSAHSNNGNRSNGKGNGGNNNNGNSNGNNGSGNGGGSSTGNNDGGADTGENAPSKGKGGVRVGGEWDFKVPVTDNIYIHTYGSTGENATVFVNYVWRF